MKVLLRIVLGIAAITSLVSSASPSAELLDTTVQSEDFSEFWLVVEQRLTMADFDDVTSPMVVLYNTSDQLFYHRTDGAKVEAYPAADGLHKLVIVVNGTLPGPTLVVRENSTVRIHVTNNLQTEGTALHFHGMLQTMSFWSDGAAPVTQCAIRPGERFTYEFKAEPSGTFWYHAHVGTQRADGMYGAFIVLPVDPSVPFQNGARQIPDGQYVVALGDWYPTEAHVEYSFGKWDLMKFYPSYTDLSSNYAETRAIDGSIVGETVFHALLVNGRGWATQSDLVDTPWRLPLEIFRVDEEKDYLLRLINTAVNFPQMFSIDDHQLLVAATDGNFIEPTLVDFVIIFPGERYDVWVVRQLSANCTQCFMKIQTLEYYDGSAEPGWSPLQHFTLAYWSYDNEKIRMQRPEVNLSSRCSEREHCRVLNCAFPYPDSQHLDCIYVDQLRALHPSPVISHEEDEFVELFVNLFDDRGMNGITFLSPRAPPAMHPGNEKSVITPCNEFCNTEQPCSCTQIVNIPLGTVVHLVLYNRVAEIQTSAMDLDAFAHPMHLHGYNWRVVKVGHGEYNTSGSGILTEFNQDIDCGTDDSCNNGGWANNTWVHGRFQNIELTNTVVKDTLAVPMGGYAVLRFKADNPGWWLLHCHILPHLLNGMSMLLRVGEPKDLPLQPDHQPKC